MAEFPFTPIPSAVSAPELIDVSLSYQVDQGYEVRRAKWSRPRRRWTLEYLGKSTDELRMIRDFLLQQRLGTLDFAWRHPTAIDPAVIDPGPPVTANWRHGLFTGMWILVGLSPVPGVNNTAWQIDRVNEVAVVLRGAVPSGIQGPGIVQTYVPHARAVMSQDDTFASPTTLIGPEQIGQGARRSGYFSFAVQIEELF